MSVGYRRLPTDVPEDGADHPSDSCEFLREVHDEDVSVTPVNEDVDVGVRKVEASLQVYGRYSRWCLFGSVALASYIYALDSSTTPAYLTFATSSFGEHSLISAITVVQSLIVAVGKPIIAKVADASSRGTAYVAVCDTVIALSPSIGAIAGGIILYAIGYTGLQLLTQIIIADITTLKWRGLVVSLATTPFLVNAFIGPNISAAVIEHLGWRWGYGMFAILVPLALSPLISTLFWAEGKAKKLALLPLGYPHNRSRSRSSRSRSLGHAIPRRSDALKQRFLSMAEQLDLVGLILLGAAVSFTVLPFTRNESTSGRWGGGRCCDISLVWLCDLVFLGLRIMMFFIGVIFWGIFAYWESRIAKRPVVAPRFVRNRGVMFAAFIGFFDFMSYFLTFTYLYSFVLVVKPWSLVDATYFMQIQTVGLTIAGVIADSSDAELIATQLLQGLGGGLAAITSQVGAQASVPHADVAIATAIMLLLTEIGGAIGNGCAGAIWARTMPQNLEKFLPWLSDEERAELFGSITSVTSLPYGDPVREGVIQAYGETMKVMVLCAIVFSVLPIFLALGMPNWYLGDQQNAVDSEEESRELGGSLGGAVDEAAAGSAENGSTVSLVEAMAQARGECEEEYGSSEPFATLDSITTHVVRPRQYPEIRTGVSSVSFLIH
ncbi:hypothetical protein ID866_4765 [Astraeus odoratus]|nr:hypothetical protein ID866_4765 [Astraeus odoratus]